MIALRRAKGRAVAPLFALTTFVAAWLVAASSLSAEAPRVSDADRAVAAELAAQVSGDLESSDPGEAARLLLRAVRWDPSRWGDYRAAIGLMESIDPEAAARHAVAELRGPARFTKGDAKLLTRLLEAALESEDDATWRGAAEIAQAAAEQTAKQGPRQSLEAARLWGEAGATYSSIGDYRAASDAFERLQRLAAAGKGDRLRRAYRWDLVAASHLEVDEFDRAAAALELLRDDEGETTPYFTLQSQLALRLEEPLAAIGHAEQAVESVIDFEGEADEADGAAYAALIEAMHTANQADRAADRFVKLSKAAPADTALALAAIDARINAGRMEFAWTACGKLIERLAAELPLVEGYLGADSAADPARLSAYASAVTRRLRLAPQLGRVRDALDESVGWVERLGNLDSLWGELDRLGGEDEFRAQAVPWLEECEADLKATPAQNLAAATIAFHVDRTEDSVAFLGVLFKQAQEKGATDEAIAEASMVWGATLLSEDAFADAETLLAAPIDLLGSSEAAPAIAPLRSRLARAIISQQVATGHSDAARIDEALRMISVALEEAPDDGDVAHQAICNSLYAGRPDDVIAHGEKVFERWPAPDEETRFGSRRYHEASEAFAAALLLRDEPGDADRAAELLEASLDRWPQSRLALTYLAWRDSRTPEGAGRALRLAQEAVEIDADASDSRGFLGVVQLRAGRIEEGIESLRQALAVADENALSLWEREVFRHELAEALRADGRAEEAEVVESEAPTNL